MVKIVKFVYVIIIFISLFFIAKNVEGRVKCIKDYGCQNKSCQFPLKPYIRTGRVTCKNDSGCELKLCKLPLFPKCVKPYFLFFSTKEGFCACN
ncbi:putative Late nodulin [Medicago truncatula]|uniref:Nodule Cysteine-Rich (NCR) secreted peptide n=1 Tax=Medicago truncatula TaxID=3880 RepID=A0A072UYQ3_MEDTR|nr:Nodule Cysteine-Rich (NCR) secreted peptide [Medicago truncatula]RHN68025.1 putative Late nodulin [Medicago truncatula]